MSSRRPKDEPTTIRLVSMLQLIVTPERFYGEQVYVKGYAVIEFENSCLYVSKEIGGLENAVGLEFSNSTVVVDTNGAVLRGSNPKQLTGTNVFVLGRLRPGGSGHPLWHERSTVIVERIGPL